MPRRLESPADHGRHHHLAPGTRPAGAQVPFPLPNYHRQGRSDGHRQPDGGEGAPAGMGTRGAEAGRLDALPGAPKPPREIVEEFGLDAAVVRTAMIRRVRAGQTLRVGREYLAVLAAEETPAPAGPVAPEVAGYDPYDDPFAAPNDWTWQPDKLDDFAEEEAAELVLIRVGGMHGADDCGGGSIPTPCRPSITDAWA